MILPKASLGVSLAAGFGSGVSSTSLDLLEKHFNISTLQTFKQRSEEHFKQIRSMFDASPQTTVTQKSY